MLLCELIERIKKAKYDVKAKISKPHLIISGIQYYADQSILQNDILYISFEVELPIQSAHEPYTLLILSSSTIDIAKSKHNNLLHYSNPSNYTAFINTLSNILANNYKLTETVCNITRSFFHKQGIQKVFNESHKLFENPLLLVDSNNKMIAYSPTKDEVFSSFSPIAHKEYSLHLHDLQKKLPPPMAPIYLLHPAEKYYMFASNIIINGYIIGTLLLLERNRNFSDNDKHVFDSLIHIITQMLADSLLYSHTKGHISSLLLDDVLDTPNYPPIMLERQLDVLGFKGYQKFRFAVMAFESSPSYSVFDELTSAIDKLFPSELYTVRSEKIVLMLINNSASLEKKVLSKLQNMHQKYQLLIGISNSFSNLSETHRHYQQALTALNYCGKITDAASQYYIFYDYIAQLELLKTMTKVCNMLDFCSPDILELLKYDQQYQTDFAQTLSVYLNCFGDAVFAAQKLRIHKNTLYYRLGVIKDIVNNDLTDGETNYLYMFAFRTLQYLGRFYPIDL